MFLSREPVGVVDEYVIPVRFCALLGASLKSRVERVGDIGNDTSNGLCPLGTQTLGDAVGDIAEPLRGAKDFLLGNRRYGRVADPVEDEGNGRLRDLSEFSDVFLGGTHGGSE